MGVRLLNLNQFKLLKRALIIFIIFIIFTALYFPNYARLKRLKQANAKLLSQINELEQEINDLQIKIEEVDKNPYLYEKLARENIGAAREGEIVIDIEE